VIFDALALIHWHHMSVFELLNHIAYLVASFSVLVPHRSDGHLVMFLVTLEKEKKHVITYTNPFFCGTALRALVGFESWATLFWTVYRHWICYLIFLTNFSSIDPSKNLLKHPPGAINVTVLHSVTNWACDLSSRYLEPKWNTKIFFCVYLACFCDIRPADAFQPFMFWGCFLIIFFDVLYWIGLQVLLPAA
jgi:hypothetical protein